MSRAQLDGTRGGASVPIAATDGGALLVDDGGLRRAGLSDQFHVSAPECNAYHIDLSAVADPYIVINGPAILLGVFTDEAISATITIDDDTTTVLSLANTGAAAAIGTLTPFPGIRFTDNLAVSKGSATNTITVFARAL